MCGITGFYGLEDKNLLKRMSKTLIHRGPDEENLFFEKNIGLAQRRLSIIDLKKGLYPIHNEKKTVWLVFNGEIYNFKKLKQELEKNHKFYTKTDAEVLVHLYEDYGEKLLSKINGMFAFVIWDSKKKKFFAAIDRIGQKPFYYALINKKFLFASELKAILEYKEFKRKVDLSSINDYLSFGYIPPPNTIFKGIHKLIPGHYLIYQGGDIKVLKYWDLNNEKKIFMGEDAYCKKILNLLQDSIKKRLVSDVPIGIFLSGGIDSSLITAIASKLKKNVKTFSIGFSEKNYNEIKYARIISEKFDTDHNEFFVEPDAIKILPKIIWAEDEPFSDSSEIPTYYVSKIARKKIKVALGGDGGDELFAGYERRYKMHRLVQKYQKIPKTPRKFIKTVTSSINKFNEPRSFLGKVKRFNDTSLISLAQKHTEWMSEFKGNMKEKLLIKGLEKRKNYFESFSNNFNNNYLDNILYLDLKTYLPNDVLVKVDRCSMINSLEVRAPFLDYRFVEFVNTIPSKFKLKGRDSKYILKKSAEKILPKEIIKKPKQGFNIPLKEWFKDELNEFSKQILFDKRLSKRGIFNEKYIKKIFENHIKNKGDYSSNLWSLLKLELWFRRFVDCEKKII